MLPAFDCGALADSAGCLRLPFSVASVRGYALIDSGAACSVVGQSFLARIPPDEYVSRRANVSLLTATGVPITCDSRVELTLVCSSCSLTFSGLVAPIAYDIILGMDFFKRYSPHFDWGQGIMSLVLLGQTHHLACAWRQHHLGKDTAPCSLLADPATFYEDSSDLGLCPLQPLAVCDEAVSKPSPLDSLLTKFKDLFKDLVGVPPRRSVEHCLNLDPTVAIPFQRGRRFSPTERAAIAEEVAALEKKGLVIPSQAPTGAPVLFVKKKDGSARMVVDYRALNAATIADRFPLPRIEDLIILAAKAVVFSKMDLASGFHQVRMRQCDQDLTSFITPNGLWKWVVMPFGLKNAPSTFQKLMTTILRPYLDKFVVVYIDDILVFSESVDDHKQHVFLVFEALLAAGVKLKRSKCSFQVTEVEFCGHRLTPGAVAPVQEKIATMLAWPAPTKVKELQAMLGFAQFYHRFVPGYSKIVAPLTDLLRKNVRWDWTHLHDKAFASLKTAFHQVTDLAQPDYTLPFIVHVDASDEAAGCTLSQRTKDGVLRLLECRGKKFDDTQRRYPVHERELLALVIAMGTWHHLVMGSRIEVFSDSISLVHLRKQPNMSKRQATWIEKLAAYDIHIQHIPGAQNSAADALSRLPCTPLPLDPGVSQSEPREVDCWLSKYQTDPEIRKRYLTEDGQLRPGQRLINGQLWIEGRVLVPKSEAASIVLQCHADGHWGTKKTIQMIQRKYIISGLHGLVKQLVRGCDVCQRTKHDHGPSVVRQAPLPCQKWHTIHLDWMEGLPPAGVSRFDSLLVCVDAGSRMSHLIPTHRNATAMRTANQLLTGVIRLHGLPRVIRTDRDPRFMSELWGHVCRSLDIVHTPTVAFNPRANGVVERCNSLVATLIRQKLLASHQNWVDLLPSVELALNNRPLEMGKLTPFYLNFGYHPVMPRDIVFDQDQFDATEQAKEFAERLQRDFGRFQQALRPLGELPFRDPLFQVGDLVMVSATKRHFHPKIVGGNKFEKYPWFGPFKVLRVLSSCTYEIDLPHTWGVHRVLPENYLRKYVHSDAAIPRVLPQLSKSNSRLETNQSGSIMPGLPPRQQWSLPTTSPQPSPVAAPIPVASPSTTGHQVIVERQFPPPQIESDQLTSDAPADPNSECLETRPIRIRCRPSRYSAAKFRDNCNPEQDEEQPPSPNVKKRRKRKRRLPFADSANGVGVTDDDIQAPPHQRQRLAALEQGDVPLNCLVFQAIVKRFGIYPQVDWFASKQHHQLPNYFAATTDAMAAGTDAFSANWNGCVGFWNPPWKLLDRVVEKIKHDRAFGILVCPWWPNSSWFSMLMMLVHTAVLLPPSCFLTDSCLFTLPPPPWRTAALLVDGSLIAIK